MAESPGFERADLGVRGVVAAALAIVAAIAAAAGGAWLTLRMNAADPGGPNTEVTIQVEGSPLQSSARTDREAFFRQKEQQLSSYGWSDHAHGRVHIPIEEAMRDLAAKPQEAR